MHCRGSNPAELKGTRGSVTEWLACQATVLSSVAEWLACQATVLHCRGSNPAEGV
ncbi:unnamed protein product [Protopolystoma xenopodis]|uniref:Uncharacterized protein n=1 Tax=Protopolystoma xenopodis TaxID=117903 RepID=A0A3S5BC41_9PLAT|nr:unnamed protein product [Protopolystoma xenopodis]